MASWCDKTFIGVTLDVTDDKRYLPLMTFLIAAPSHPALPVCEVEADDYMGAVFAYAHRFNVPTAYVGTYTGGRTATERIN